MSDIYDALLDQQQAPPLPRLQRPPSTSTIGIPDGGAPGRAARYSPVLDMATKIQRPSAPPLRRAGQSRQPAGRDRRAQLWKCSSGHPSRAHLGRSPVLARR